MGRRARDIQEGRFGPVLKRWVNADVVPIADNLRRVASLYLAGDMEGVALALGTPTTALSHREKPLRPLMEWVHRGRSPGRQELKLTTYAEDLALSFMGTLIPRLAAAEHSAITLSAGLSLAADALRDTVQGQFITSIQGAEAMQKVRQKRPEVWAQRKSLRRIASQLQSQIKPQFLAEDRGEVSIPVRGNRKVLEIADHNGELRRIELKRKPDATDWEVMSLCWHDLEKSSADHPHRQLWLSFAAMMLSLAQQTGGWFEVADTFKTSSGRRKHKTKMLVLSEKAVEAIERDVERWVGSGFIAEPMLVPPEDGDFLSVKHRKVTGQRPPKGMATKAEGTFAWGAACHVASSPWCINEFSPALNLDVSEDPWLAMKLGAHRRLAGQEFYLPVNMDFRGRIYYRTPWVTPQSGDLGKSLLRFPSVKYADFHLEPVALHFSGLFGNDKLPVDERLAWWGSLDGEMPEGAEYPLTFAAHWKLLDGGRWDEIPVQLDGTCNGLQHLSALMRDEEGGAQVNLTRGGSKPQDVYGKVAAEVLWQITLLQGNPDAEPCPEWIERLHAAGVEINRGLCKGPVMVLPYGGTLEAIRLAVKASVLSQLGVADGEVSTSSPWHLVEEDGYGAFRERNLPDHPLFNEDIRKLAGLIHKSITPAIPKAMACMDTLQRIGSWLGSRALAWRTGPSALTASNTLGQGCDVAGEGGLWVTQAKSKSQRKQVTMKGFHLPEVIQRLTLVTQTNEVDPRAHRTGIVANFTHGLDASHLARAVVRFKELGGTCLGTIHDCVMVRPSEAALMHRALRETFMEMYLEDPLSQPVRVIETEGLDEGKVTEYPSWYALAEAAGTSFPLPGKWEPSEVLDSQWFFS